jgi:DNA-binding beta-propeller fold protein YncE
MTDVAYSQLLAPGQFRVIAGKLNSRGEIDGNRSKARFLSPAGIFVNPDGSLLVADNSGSVRKLLHDTVVTTIHFPLDPDGFEFSGGFDVAATKDGTIGVTDFQALWPYTPDGVLHYHGVDSHDAIGQGIDKDPAGGLFWYTNFTDILAVDPKGELIDSHSLTGGSAFTGLSASNNGVKYITTSGQIFKYTKSGVTARILTDFTYTYISSITSTRDGFKLYIADGGDIKMISNNPKYPKTIKTILSGQHAMGVALSNSEKYLYFTTGSEYNTINKLTL